MSHYRRAAVLLVAACAATPLSGCGPQRVRTPEARSSDFILLLPDPEDGVTGRAVISAASGNVQLDSAREYTRVAPGQTPAPVSVMSEGDVRRLFGDALQALPPPTQHFTLNFRFESDELTDESRELISEILKTVKKRPVPEVAVIGHTDTTGTLPSNYQLGLKRAEMIRNLLVAGGLDRSYIEVTSHGEGDPLVTTADGVLEPRNRRVEITVR